MTGDGAILVITGCLSKEPEITFLEWLDKKIYPVNFLSQRSLEKDGLRPMIREKLHIKVNFSLFVNLRKSEKYYSSYK